MGRSNVDLLDPKTMDGPVIKFTMADLLKSNPKVLLAYHAMITPFGIFNTAGVLLGGALYGVGVRRLPSALAMMGTTGIIAGTAGMALGLSALASKAQKGEEAEPPWNADGIEQRVNGLSHNYKVRAMDLGVWCGSSLALGALLVNGGAAPPSLKLSAGRLGLLQSLSLGSFVGVSCAMGNIYSVFYRSSNDE
jgi:hypothetical protein